MVWVLMGHAVLVTSTHRQRLTFCLIHRPPTSPLQPTPPLSPIPSFLPAPGLGNEGYDGAAWAAEEFNEAAKEGTLETEGTTERTDGGVHVCERG